MSGSAFYQIAAEEGKLEAHLPQQEQQLPIVLYKSAFYLDSHSLQQVDTLDQLCTREDGTRKSEELTYRLAFSLGIKPMLFKLHGVNSLFKLCNLIHQRIDMVCPTQDEALIMSFPVAINLQTDPAPSKHAQLPPCQVHMHITHPQWENKPHTS